MKALSAIKNYFEMTAQQAARETKELSHADRQELGNLACIELGETFEPTEEKKK